MADTKVVTKSLAAGEDLLLTPGKTQQNRAGTLVNVQGIAVQAYVANETQLAQIDKDKFKRALLLVGTLGQAYLYSETDSTGIPSIYGGYWIKEASSLIGEEDGLKYIGRCPTIAVLRTIIPTTDKQIISVVEYATGNKVGGGIFYYDASDSTSADDGGSIIVTTTGGARWKRQTDQLLPVHFGALPGNTTDSTEPLRRYIAASTNKTVDFRGSNWTISGTLVMTSVSRIVADNSGTFIVNPVGFDGTWVITIGTPEVPAGFGRANRVVIDGTLIIGCMNRSAPLNGVYLKGEWFNMGHIRVSNMNGTGVQQEAVWDSTISRISTELCGNSAQYAYVQTGAGDTHNTTHIGAIQVEQSYNKAISMSGIRDVIDNIHCERTYITTLDDGTTGLVSGLTYTTCFFNMGNSTINQAIIDAFPGSNAPDGTPCVTSVPSIGMSMDYSAVVAFNAPDSVISCGFGRETTYTSLVAKTLYIAEPAEKISVITPRIIDTLFLGSEIMVENGIIGTLTPRNNAYNINVKGGEITTIAYTTNIRGAITFEGLTVTDPILDLTAPSGSSSGTSIGAAYSPTLFINCALDVVTGAFNSRAVFDKCLINTVSLASQAAFEFLDTDVKTFGYTGNVAFLTRGVKADTVTNWSRPLHYIYPAGTITERIGAMTAGTAVLYVSTSNVAVTWSTLASI